MTNMVERSALLNRAAPASTGSGDGSKRACKRALQIQNPDFYRAGYHGLPTLKLSGCTRIDCHHVYNDEGIRVWAIVKKPA